MGKTEKRFNKWLIWLVIGGAIVGGLSKTEKGKSFWRRMNDRIKKSFSFFRRGLREIKKSTKSIKK